MRIALGVLGGLAVAVSGAGWWAVAGIVLAAVLVLAADRTDEDRTDDDRGDSPAGDSPAGDSPAGSPAGDGSGDGHAIAVSAPAVRRLLDGVARAARLGVVVFAASTFATYLVPDHRQATAVLFVAAVALVDVAGGRLDAYWRRWVGGLLALAGAAFVAVCLGVSPVPPPVHAAAVATAIGGVWGLPLATAVFVPVFGDASRRVVVAGGVLAAGVAAAALYQLGPLRLGLSETALRDVFVAADAQALTPVLGAVVALACAPAALGAFTAARRNAHPSRVVRTVVPAAVAAVPAALLSPTGAVTVAAGLALAELVVRAVATRPRTGRRIAVAAAGIVAFGGLVAGL